MREALFSAVRVGGRGGIAARAAAGARVRGHPLGRRGHARPDRVPGAAGCAAPLLLVCLARDELLDRRPGWGGGRRDATTILLDPLDRERDARAGRGAARRAATATATLVAAVAERSGGNPLFAEEMVTPDRRGGQRRAADAARHRAGAARRPARLARRRSSAGWCSTPRWSAARSGRARSRDRRPSEGARPRARRSTSLQEKDMRRARAPAAGWPASASTPSSTC